MPNTSPRTRLSELIEDVYRLMYTDFFGDHSTLKEDFEKKLFHKQKNKKTLYFNNFKIFSQTKSQKGLTAIIDNKTYLLNPNGSEDTNTNKAHSRLQFIEDFNNTFASSLKYVIIIINNNNNKSYYIQYPYSPTPIKPGTIAAGSAATIALTTTDPNYKYIKALKAKPFLILSGISGTGKSQKVKELAYASCQNYKQGQKPDNYCLVPVKPNWNSSREILGYYSQISGKYEYTDTVRFIYEAINNPDEPFFLCLDEMNLAPVEYYFAEFLSIMESRYEDTTTKTIKCDTPLLRGKDFNSYDINTGDQYYNNITSFIKNNSLYLPDNLMIIGTVNVDDTTKEFSRKVIDRAFLIEMNGGDLASALAPNPLIYSKKYNLSDFRSIFVQANTALSGTNLSSHKNNIISDIPKFLKEINYILKNTPFTVSYRVQNELILYMDAIADPSYGKSYDDIKEEACLAALLEKILPRIKGDIDLLDTTVNGATKTVLDDLIGYIKTNLKSSTCKNAIDMRNLLLDKLDEMQAMLSRTGFTNYFK